MKRRITILATCGLLAACGFNGTDPDEGEASAQAEAVAPADPDFEAFELADIADPETRPVMQAQVVLDARGFGPGVIDGGLGMSTENALRGFQEASGLDVTGRLDDATRQALAQWQDVPATRVVRIPESWGRIAFRPVPDEPGAQARLDHLGYATLDEKLAERFHTTVDVLRELNPAGRPAGAAPTAPSPSAAATPANGAASQRGADPAAAGGTGPAEPVFRPGQLVRVPNVGLDAARGDAGRGSGAAGEAEDQDWNRTLASLGVARDQPDAARIVVDKSEGTLRAYDANDELIALFTVTTGSEHDPLPLGEWKVLGVARNPPFHYNPDLFWDADADDEKARLPPGPNGPVGVVWIDLDKEHYGIHGTPEPQTIGRAESHGCVRLANWDAARLAGMVSGSTEVLFQA